MKKLVVIAALLFASNAFAINADPNIEPFATYSNQYQKDFNPDLRFDYLMDLANSKSARYGATVAKRYNVGMLAVENYHNNFKKFYEAVYDDMKKKGEITDDSRETLDKVYKEMVRVSFLMLKDDLSKVTIGGAKYDKIRNIVISEIDERDKKYDRDIAKSRADLAKRATATAKRTGESMEMFNEVLSRKNEQTIVFKKEREKVRKFFIENYDNYYEDIRAKFAKEKDVDKLTNGDYIDAIEDIYINQVSKLMDMYINNY